MIIPTQEHGNEESYAFQAKSALKQAFGLLIALAASTELVQGS